MKNKAPAIYLSPHVHLENRTSCMTRVSKFVAENVFNKGIFYSTKYSTMNPTINDKEIFQILVKIDDFVQIMGKNLGFFKFRPKLMIFLKFWKKNGDF